MVSHIDRRAHVRESIDLPARVLSNHDGAFQAQVCDLSVNGARLLATRAVRPEEQVTVILQVLDEPDKVVCATGKAVRVEGITNDTYWDCEMAVEFDSPLNEDAETSVRWLRSRGY